MKKYIKLFSVLILSSALVLGSTSCSDDDGYSLGDYWEDLVTVNKIGDNTYDFTLDSGEKLWVAAPAGISLKPKYKRAIINYTILSDKQGEYDHYVKLNGYIDVLTKEAIYIAADDNKGQDSIGYNPIKVHSMWESGGYLNIYFGYNAGNKESHMLNLVSAEPGRGIGEDEVNLEFRHNQNNDPEHYGAAGYVCFDLAPYEVAGKDMVTFNIVWKDFDGTTQSKKIEYKLNGTGATPAKNVIPSANDITNLNIY